MTDCRLCSYVIVILLLCLYALQLNLEPWMRAYPRPKLPKQHRTQAHCQRNKRQYRIPPPQPQRLIHRRTRQREHRTDQRPQDGIRGRHRGRMREIGIDQVGIRRHEDGHEPNGKDGRPEDWHDPVRPCLGGPAVPE